MIAALACLALCVLGAGLFTASRWSRIRVEFLVWKLHEADDRDEADARHLVVAAGPPAVPHLMGALNDEDPTFRRRAGLALCAMSDPALRGTYVLLINNTDPVVQEEALRALARVDPDEAFRHATTLVAACNIQMRQCARDTFTKLLSPANLRDAVSICAVSNADTQMFVMNAVTAEIEPDAAIPRLASIAAESGGTERRVSLLTCMFVLARQSWVRPDAEFAPGDARWANEAALLNAIRACILDRDPAIRTIAVSGAATLASRRVPDAAHLLTACLADKSETSDVRRSALMGMREAKLPGCFGTLLKLLATGHDDLTSPALFAIPDLAAADDEPAFLKFFSTGPVSARRKADVAEAFSRFMTERSIPAMISTLCDSEDDLKPAARDALGRIVSRQTADRHLCAKLLVTALPHLPDSDFALLSALLTQLTNYDPGGLDASGGSSQRAKRQDAWTAWWKAYGNADSTAWNAAIAKDALDALKTGPPASGVRAVRQIARVGGRPAVEAAMWIVENSSDDVFDEACRSLPHHMDDAALARLAELIKGQGTAARRSAIFLGCTTRKEAVEPLIGGLASSDDKTAVACAKALTSMAAPNSSKPLLDAMLKGSSELRSACVDGIIGNADESVVPAAKELLTSTDAELRAGAALITGWLGSDADIPALVAMIDDADSKVRWSASKGLDQITGRGVDFPAKADKETVKQSWLRYLEERKRNPQK
jgi:HEAT repeat protein